MFATLMIAGSSGAVTQTECGRSARAIRRATIRCSSRSLSERSSCSPRWSSTAGSAERRVEPASATVDARWPSRRTSSSGEAATNAASPRPAQKTKQEPKAARSTPNTAAASCGAGRVDGDLAGEHDLLEVARADPLDGARDGALVVLGRRDRLDVEAPRGRGIEQRERAGCAARRRAPRAARPPARGSSSGATAAASVSATEPPRRATATSGTTRSPAAKPCQWRAAPPSGANAKPPTATSPAPAGPSGTPATALAASSRHVDAASRNRSRPARADRPHAAERRQRGAVAVGLLEAEPRLAGAARGERERARVRRARDGHGDRGQHLRAARAGAAHRALAAREQLTAGAGRERERPARRCDPDAHAPQGRASGRAALRPPSGAARARATTAAPSGSSLPLPWSPRLAAVSSVRTNPAGLRTRRDQCDRLHHREHASPAGWSGPRQAARGTVPRSRGA